MQTRKFQFKLMGLLLGTSLFLSLMSCSAQMSESKKNSQVDFNGSFEVFEDGLPVNWLVYTSKTVKTGDFSISSDSNEFKLGNQSLKFDIKNCSAEGGRFSPGISQELAAKANETYQIKFWAKNNGSSFKFSVNGVSAFGRGDAILITSDDSISVWKEYTCTYTIPQGMDKLRIEFNALKPGTIWIDGVVIERK